jgi:ketosteroid isomerase-like protein
LAAEEAARKQAEEEAAARAAAEEAKRRAAEEEAARLAAEEAARKRAEEEATHAAAARAAAALSSTSEVSGDVDHVEPPREGSTGSRLRPLWGRFVNWLREPPAPSPVPAAEPVPLPPPSIGASNSNFDIARLYLEALSSAATPAEIGQFFAPEAIQDEFPHRFLETTVTRGFASILEARAASRIRFSPQRYELAGATGGGSQVAMEVRWKGRVAATGEGYTEGQELDARVALFLKFAAGKIVRQRIYTCFEPWSTKAERLLTLDERVAQAGQSTGGPPPVLVAAPPPALGSNFDVARSYLEALSARADAETIARFHTADAVQDELPNRLLPAGAHRDLPAIMVARSRALAMMASETYELLGATGGGSQVALEVGWSGVVGDGLGLFTTGQRLETRSAFFLKFRDGRIAAQRIYHCA